MKKTTFAFLLCCLSILVPAQSPEKVKIQDAVKEGKVSYDLRGALGWENGGIPDSDEGFYGKCMVLRLKSLVSHPLEISVPNGLMLMCENKNVQDMVVTKSMKFTLPAMVKDTVLLYAMCSEMHDGSPSYTSGYSFGSLADKSLSSITKVIQEMQKFYKEGQHAVWAYRDKATKAELEGYGATAKSLKVTYEILDRAGVVTKLHPKLKDHEPAAAPIPADSVTAIPAPDGNDLEWYEETLAIPMYWVIAAGGFVFTLCIITLRSSLRSRKRSGGGVA